MEKVIFIEEYRGKIYNITVARGDGIGPEIVDSALKVLRSAISACGDSIAVNIVPVEIGWDAYKKYGTSLPKNSIDKISRSDGLILGPLSVGGYPQDDPGGPSPSGKIRKKFNLYANIRPIKFYGLNPYYNGKDIDFVILRENTEGFYADRSLYLGNGEFMPSKDMAISLRIVSRKASRKIIAYAFSLAEKRKNKVTCVHKGNVLKVTDGLFLEEFYSESRRHPNVSAETRLVDSMSYHMIKEPEKFDLIVTTNMYGDILSDEAAFIAGSLGLCPSLNMGEKISMAQAAHGSAPDIAGKGIANPMAEILSVALLFQWLGVKNNDTDATLVWQIIQNSVNRCVLARERLTPDLGGDGTLLSITEDIMENIKSCAP